MNSSETWRTAVDDLVYAVQFAEELTSDLAAGHARRLLAKPAGTFTQEEQYEALAHATTGTDLGAGVPDQPHTDEDLRAFVAEVVAEMDRQRPWTQPALRPLPLERWSEFADAPAVAALDVPFPEIMQRLQQSFTPAPDDGRLVCLLQLAPGDELAIADEWWPGADAMAVLTRADEPREVLDYLIAHTALTDEELTPVEQSAQQR
jgi:hypothetical protein